MSNKKRVSRALKQQEVIKRFKQIHGNKYDYSLFIYTNIITKSIIKCNTCGLIFKQTAHVHFNGHGCPKCHYSKGEAALENIFIKNNIKYEAQFKLPYYNYEYDFHLPDYGVLVEFHDKQHYEPVMEFGGIERFNRQIENDKIKRSLAREYRTLLIEVHYKYLDHKNIEKFEQFFLKKLERNLKSSNWMTS